MPLITRRQDVLEHYAAAARRVWVLPAFNTENQTGLEAILSAALETATALGYPQMPIILGLTNRYWHRPQTEFYTQTRNWKIGLKLFLDDVATLTGPDSPYAELSVMVHLDHIQWDADAALLEWDLTGRVSSIMYDASTLPFEENIAKTADFVKSHGDRILVAGPCRRRITKRRRLR